ncbi:zinc metalloprotease HtpX [Azotosporobacter soli]|uniref:zinc metalloprotease HtpX n=1 Tax=Azotosporobacter soli TaxID=3055040 RepID=UPI0031FE7FE9
MNNLKTTVLMAALTGFMLLLGASFGGKGGLLLMLIMSLAMNLGSYWFSDRIVLSMYNAQEVTAQEAPDLHRMVQNLAARASLPMPRVYIMQDPSPNAFATGRNPEHGVVAVTTGIMQALSPDELSGVIAHELAHIKHRDTLISTVAAAMAGVITYMAHMAQWAAMFGGLGRSSDDDESGGSGLIGSLFMIILAPIAATLIQMGISRSREYVADESGGQICGNPLALASALEKIEYYAKHRVMPNASPSTAHMFIINPFSGGGQWFLSLFSTHPATQERIARLRQQAQLPR